MPQDKFSALWISHSSMRDYLTCPRLYYLRNIYRDPKTGHKIQLMAPSLALGQAVHDVLESLSVLPVEKRFEESLLQKFERSWQRISGEKGGFTHPQIEEAYKKRGQDMLTRVTQHPGILKNKAIKIKEELPHYWFSEEENIILCGKIDWLEYLEDTDSVNIIDFKTGKNMEDGNSLQLPIYYLLVKHTQKREVTKASYWYLELSDTLVEKPLPDEKESCEKIMGIAKEIKLARKLNRFKCPTDGCKYCIPFEKILQAEATFVGVNDYNQDIFILPELSEPDEDESVIL